MNSLNSTELNGLQRFMTLDVGHQNADRTCYLIDLRHVPAHRHPYTRNFFSTCNLHSALFSLDLMVLIAMKHTVAIFFRTSCESAIQDFLENTRSPTILKTVSKTKNNCGFPRFRAVTPFSLKLMVMVVMNLMIAVYFSEVLRICHSGFP